MVHRRDLPELVRDSELGVTIRDNITIHTEPLECRDSYLPQIWETKKTIGRGGDGTVFLQQKTGGPGAMDVIAVKQMGLNAELASEDHDSKRYVRELEALAKFAQGRYSRWFVRSYGWYQDEGWLYICMEYCKHLDLGKYLKAHGTLSEEYARAVALQVLQGLLRMHMNEIAHRDLKPANILIHRKPPEDEAWWVVLGDLGLSRRSGASSGTTTIRGTPSFMAPETIGKPFLGLPRDADPFSADMWCLGESIACALTGKRTFSDNEHLLRYQNRQASFPDNVLKELSVSIDAIDFIRSLMDVDPLRRLTATQALNHPWIMVNHVSNTQSSDTTIAITAPSARSNTRIVIRTSDGEFVAPEDRQLYTHDQATQASAQWTQTTPVLSEDTQASATWTETVVDPVMPRSSPDRLDHPTVRQLNLEDTTAQTKGVPAPDQTAGSAPSSKAESAFSQGDRNLEVVAEQLPSNTLEREQSLLDKFNAFSAASRLRISEKQQNFVREDRLTKFADLKKFGQNFQLKTPVPIDLIPILSNDEDKQEQIVASSIQRIKQNSTPIKADKTTLAPRRQLYGNAALPPAPKPGAQPPPAALRPPPAPTSNSTLSSSRPRPQRQTKALSETQTRTPKAAQNINPSRWEEAVRRQEAIAQSLTQPSKAAVAASGTVEEPQTQVSDKKKKKKKGGG